MSLPQHADVGISVPPGIDLMSLPGAHSLLRLALWKFVAPLLVYPAKMTLPIMENSGVEPASTGMIKLSVLGGSGFDARAKLAGSGAGAARRRAGGADGNADGADRKSSFLSSTPLRGLNSLVKSRYLVQLHTRESRKITLASKSSDAPTWDETHHFLTNPDAALTATVMTTNLKELGRCEIPLRRLVADDRARRTTLLHIPLGDPKRPRAGAGAEEAGLRVAGHAGGARGNRRGPRAGAGEARAGTGDASRRARWTPRRRRARSRTCP